MIAFFAGRRESHVLGESWNCDYKKPPRIWFPLDPIRLPSLLPRPHWRFFSTHISSNAIALPWLPARRQFRSADVLRVAAHRQRRHSDPLIAIESQPAHLMMASHCSCAAAGPCATPRRHARARPSNTASAAAVGRLPTALSSMCPMSTWRRWRRPSTWGAIVVVDRGGDWTLVFGCQQVFDTMPGEYNISICTAKWSRLL
jgi:hypothetical protein